MDRVGVGLRIHDVRAGKLQVARRSDEASAAVAEGIEVARRRNDDVFGWIGAHEVLDKKLIRRTEAWRKRGVEVQQRHHRRRERQVKLDVELREDEHGLPPGWTLAENFSEETLV